MTRRLSSAVNIGASVLASDPHVESVRTVGLRRVEALYDRKAAQEVVLRNLLQRKGYASLEAVQAEGLREALVAVLTARGITAGTDLLAALAGIEDPAILRSLVPRTATAASAEEFFAALRS